jgi:hypothetical protein
MKVLLTVFHWSGHRLLASPPPEDGPTIWIIIAGKQCKTNITAE